MSSFEEKAIIGLLMGEIAAPVIVELGAHIGEEFEWLNKVCRPSRYVMVEPDPKNCTRIKSECNAAVLIEGAISSRDGSGRFYIGLNHKENNRASGSIRRPTGHLKHFPYVEFTSILVTRLLKLDSLFNEQMLDHIDLLWCDIQGAERDMIEGGRATLAKTRYMMIEAEPEVELYEGQALKPELLAMLPGWIVLRDFGYNLLMYNREYKA